MAYSEYSLDDELVTFFAKTTANRSSCDARAEELVGGKAIPVAVQGNCSYSVYAGACLEYVVQFRLQSLRLDMSIASLARQVYGSLAPAVSFEGRIGIESSDKEPLHVHVMSRMKGVTHLDFILSHDTPDNSQESSIRRKRLMTGVARFFALSWKTPHPVDPSYRADMKEIIANELRMLLEALPARLHGAVRECIDSIDAVFSLPMVLLHKDFGTCNIIVDEVTCDLVGVIDWAEATI
ncbi:hypothetical protein JDV02_009342 [Purpureocillium takamizusanense]|uniref:Aminoglycoside phosphotransferase domain-containing protein n=1 Tax=Purpureocillium takamizusanense TaxID=2060973 RepID=A0A9Q8VFD3_9HYPO|nr:uncharacterized protein JDV02_009342 [Purpureocillium takamizusanense]UNI23523.1 hypothetical protein JDV02_009342 [Purpureocillium takamizusanense]